MLFSNSRDKHGLWSRIFGRVARPACPQVLSVSAFQAAFDRERALAIRSHRSFMLVVLVPTADQQSSLDAAAQFVTSRVRESDLVGLLEHDRLALLLPETDETGAQAVVESLISALAKANLQYNYRSFRYPVRSATNNDGVHSGLPSVKGTSTNGAKRNGSTSHHGENGGASGAHDPSAAMTVKWRRDAELASQAFGWPSAHESGRSDGTKVRNRPAGRSRLGGVELRKPYDVVASVAGQSLDGSFAPTLSEVRQAVGHSPAGDLQEFLEQPTSRRRRAIDILFSASLLLVLSPLLILVAALVKITTPGPVIFRQLRAGQGGRPFPFYKFRSMYMDAEERRVALEAQNEKDGPIFKIKKDPRITPIGRILRRSSIDELPQLINVLVGDMTLIGPRPPRMDEVDFYEPWQRQRLELKGGLTCIWQVSGRSEVCFNDWVRMDLQYVRRRSTWFDITLLARTLVAVASGKGAY